jgi:tripartite-type tricarboxylate transporter receptor subunit TctC
MRVFTGTILSALSGLLLLGLTSSPLHAQSWPARPVRLIVPFGPGSGTDLIARIVANEVSEVIGKPIVIENIGGAGGTIGVSRAAKAAPDGYTMVIGAVDTFAQSQYLFESPPFNAVEDFEPMALAVEQPLVLVARKNLPVVNLQEFAAYARQRPRELSFGSAGVGAAPYLACAMLNSVIGIRDVVHVPYKAAAPALQDMMMDRLDYYCPLGISAATLIQDGSLKALAILTAERSELFPNLPTAREQGVDVEDGYYWNAFFMPKGTPEPIVETMSAAIRTALDRPALRDRLRTAAGTVVAPDRRSRSYLAEYLRSEIVKWTKIMQAAEVPRQ